MDVTRRHLGQATEATRDTEELGGCGGTDNSRQVGR
jgi:hypothetical protein